MPTIPSIIDTGIHAVDKLQGHLLRAVGYLPESLQEKAHMVGNTAAYIGLDPHLGMILAAQRLKGAPGLLTENPSQARAHFIKLTRTIATKQTPVSRVDDFTIVRDDNTAMAVRHYLPEHSDANIHNRPPLLIIFHGGGFVVGNLDTVDEPCRMFCKYGQMQVLSIDYRLSPEHLAPAGLDDCITALKWAYGNAEALKIDASKICVGGDSAGGNLAAMVCQRTQATDFVPAAQLLIYPTTDFVNTYPSQTMFDKGLFLSQLDLDYAKTYYLGLENMTTRAKLYSPMFGDVSHQPPSMVVTAEFDVLRDEGEAYARKIQEAGGYCLVNRVASLGHGFINLTAVNRPSYLATMQIAHDFRMLIDGNMP